MEQARILIDGGSQPSDDPGTNSPLRLARTPAQEHLVSIYSSPGEHFDSEMGMRDWLTQKGIDLALADSKKGLRKLFEKIEAGEAKLTFDSESGRVIRCARVAKIDTEVTIHGEIYPLVELCQIFLAHKTTKAELKAADLAGVIAQLQPPDIRSAQVRDSQQLWETLIGEEAALEGARRGVQEELGLTMEEARRAQITMYETVLEYESPIDWPEIHSILETNQAKAVLPEEISKPVYWELEAGDQITIFVAAPNAPTIRALLGAIFPKIQYRPTE